MQDHCSTLAAFGSLPSNDDRRRFLESVQHESTLEHVGRKVIFDGREWKIIGINYLGDYDIERRDDRGLEMSSCRLGLPEWHPHFASLVDM